jgi:hypothetical protein
MANDAGGMPADEGIANTVAHLGHFTFLPALSSGAADFVLQAGQTKEMAIVEFQKERSAEPGIAQGTPTTGLKKQHKADAPCGARSKAALFRYKDRRRSRVVVFLKADLTHARHFRLSVRTVVRHFARFLYGLLVLDRLSLKRCSPNGERIEWPSFYPIRFDEQPGHTCAAD